MVWGGNLRFKNTNQKKKKRGINIHISRLDPHFSFKNAKKGKG